MKRPFPPVGQPLSAGTIVSSGISSCFRLFRQNFLFSLAMNLPVMVFFEVVAFVLSVGFFEGIVAQFGGPWISAANSGDFSIIVDFITDLTATQEGMLQLWSMFYLPLLNLVMWTGVLTLLKTILLDPLIYGGVCTVTLGNYHGFSDSASGWVRRTLTFYGRLVKTALCIIVSLIGIGIILLILLMLCVFILVAVANSGDGVTTSLVGLLLTLAIFVGMVLLFLFVSSWIRMVYPVCAGEAVFGFSAVKRALQLAKKKFWKVVGTGFLIMAFTWLLNMVCSWLFSFLPYFPLGAGITVSILGSLLSVIVQALVVLPFEFSAYSLLYVDVRITEEGYGVSAPSEERPYEQGIEE